MKTLIYKKTFLETYYKRYKLRLTKYVYDIMSRILTCNQLKQPEYEYASTQNHEIDYEP